MKRALAILVLSLAGCRTSEPAGADPPPQKTEPAAHVAGIGEKASGVELADAPDGDVATIVRAARDQARAKKRTLLVYIGATWCEPCKRFHYAAERGQLDAEFPTLSLLVFDLDRDGDRLKVASYAPGYVPYFGVPGDDGKATSNAMEGSIKGEGAVNNIVPRLGRLLSGAP